jgi:nucleotide-binding universal stress UspA family protein
MKTILFPTDFSENAKHAIRYGYYLSRQIKADIVLCNAVIIPAEAPQAGLVVWPMEESDTLLKDSTAELVKLKSFIEKSRNKSGFQPAISYLNQSGILTDVVNQIIANEKIDYFVIGKP